MSNKYRYRRGPQVAVDVKKTGTVAIEQGDMVQLAYASGRAHAVSLSSDSSGLFGIAMDASPATDDTATTIRVLQCGFGTTFEMLKASAASVFGEQYTINGAQTLALYTSTSPFVSATNVVAVCVKENTTAGTSVLVQFLPGGIQRDITKS